MRLFIFLIILYFFISCHPYKTTLTEAQKSDPCYMVLDRIGKFIVSKSDKLYQLNWSIINVDEYKNLSDIEKLKRDIPLDEKHQRIQKFESFITANSDFTKCKAPIDTKTIVNILGQPTSITHKEELIYKLEYGANCPCEDCTPNLKFTECNFLQFFVDSENRIERCAIGWTAIMK